MITIHAEVLVNAKNPELAVQRVAEALAREVQKNDSLIEGAAISDEAGPGYDSLFTRLVGTAPIHITAATLTAALLMYQEALLMGKVPPELQEVAGRHGKALDYDEIDGLLLDMQESLEDEGPHEADPIEWEFAVLGDLAHELMVVDGICELQANEGPTVDRAIEALNSLEGIADHIDQFCDRVIAWLDENAEEGEEEVH